MLLPVFAKKVNGTEPYPLMCLIFVAAFIVQWQSQIAAKQGLWPTKSKILILLPLIEKVC